MLGRLNTDMDRTHKKMISVDNKLKRLIATGSVCWLWIAVGVLFAILIILIIA
jgi:hypothetical protein